MLRVLYRWVLRAHPSYFRQRFADEMQSIFDHAETPRAGAGLLVDGALSLARQWSLRPQCWKEPTLATASDGTPLFHSLGNHMPSATALIYGALLSALVLNGISWTMGYAWNHPIFIEIKQPIISPPASWGVRGTSRPSIPRAVEPPLYTDQGRVILIFNSPYTTSKAAVEKPSTAGEEGASGPPANGAGSQTKRGMIF